MLDLTVIQMDVDGSKRPVQSQLHGGCARRLTGVPDQHMSCLSCASSEHGSVFHGGCNVAPAPP